MWQLFKKLFRYALAIYVFAFAYFWWRPMPELLTKPPNTHMVPESGVHFFADETFRDKKNDRKSEQHIWDEIFATIDRAKHAIILDMFLFNDFQGPTPETTRRLSGELVEKLLAKKASEKHIAITVITDPINGVYGGTENLLLARLRKAGIFVVETNLSALPDSNILWSAAWRPFISWWGNSAEGGIFPHPFQFNGNKVTLRSWFTLMNFKANHRKLLVADQPTAQGQKMVTMVTSSNPHDASSAHSNVALKVDDRLWVDAIQSETLIAKLGDVNLPSYNIGTINDATGTIRVSLLGEKWIRTKTLELLAATKKGDTVDLFMFYLSDRPVINALIDAANRGVTMRIILDPNKDAFGFTKNGIPNRPVAKELRNDSGGDIRIRWCDTHGEQCHTKLLLVKTATSSALLLGSANFTRRNIGNFNLEADILAEGQKDFTAWKDAKAYFDRAWDNTGGQFTTDYNVYQDGTLWKSSVYRMMERTGLSSF